MFLKYLTLLKPSEGWYQSIAAKMLPHLSRVEKGPLEQSRPEEPVRMLVSPQKDRRLLPLAAAVGPRSQASLSVALLKLNSNSAHSGAYMLLRALCAPEPIQALG